MELQMNQGTGGARGRVLLTLACATFVMLAALLAPMRALAAEVTSLDITQVYTTEGAVPDEWRDGTFGYELAAVDSAPLPAGATDGRYDFTIVGNTTESIALVTRQGGTDGISFDNVGDYEYDLRCTTQPADGLTLDNKTYHVTVQVENDADGDGIHVAKLVVRDASGLKPDSIEYDPSYKGELESAKPTPSKGEVRQPTVFGQKLAKTGDASWGLAVFSGILLAAGVCFVVVSLVLKRRNA